MTAERIVIVGADAAGMSAAHHALRVAGGFGRELAVTVLDKGRHTSYSACGIPYWMAGDVGSGDDLVARTAEEHRAAGIDLRLGAEVTGLDLAGRTVCTAQEEVAFDQLVIASGAHPIVPAWALDADGTPYERVGAVHTLEDGSAWLGRFESAGEGAHVVIVGGGYVGIEVAEAALRRGFGVTVLTRSRVMSSLEPEMSDRIALALADACVEVVLDAEVTGFDLDDDGRVVGVHWTGGSRPCDLVVIAIGVLPSTEFLAGSGIPVGPKGALRPDARGRVTERVWAAGDCCDYVRRITGDRVYRPLGTHANKLGRALGENLAGGRRTFDGILETAITRFAGGGEYVEIARTGLSRADAEAAAFDPVSVVTEGTTTSGYFPGAEPLALWVMADRVTRRLLGVQVVGGHGAGKRIDAAAAVLWAGGSVDDLAWMDLSYAPPFSSAWEVLQIAARRVAERI